MKGYIQVYTGNGKGKTTAAFGLAMRAAGAGFRVFIAQFLKGKKYSEIRAMERFSDLITLRQYGRDSFISDNITEKDIQLVKSGYQEAKEVILSKKYTVVILDEANMAVHYNLFSVDELLELMNLKPENVELVITGRSADKKIIDKADLVTEMCEVKHYYSKGVMARIGIEK